MKKLIKRIIRNEYKFHIKDGMIVWFDNSGNQYWVYINHLKRNYYLKNGSFSIHTYKSLDRLLDSI